MYSEIASNKRRSVVLLLFFMVVAGVLAWILGKYANSTGITAFVLVFALVYATIGYFAGGRMSLALNGAQEIQKKDDPRLWRTVENLAITDGLPMPKVYIIDDPSPNAFAT